MKKITKNIEIKKIVFVAIFFICAIVNSQVQQAFTPRFNETVKGDMTIIANNVLSRTVTGNYNGQDGNHDYDDNVYVDIDSDVTTFNSMNRCNGNSHPQY